jgi:hypothetical protein
MCVKHYSSEEKHQTKLERVRHFREYFLKSAMPDARYQMQSAMHNATT